MSHCIFQEQISKIEKEIQSIESEIKAAKLRSEETEKNLYKKEEEAEDYDENKFDDKLAEIDRKIEKQVNIRQITGEKLKQLETDKNRYYWLWSFKFFDSKLGIFLAKNEQIHKGHSVNFKRIF